jgi:catechol 2,3-dioxygenase
MATKLPKVNSKTALTGSLLASHLEMGVSELNVQNLKLQTKFYTELIGLEIFSITRTEVCLGFLGQEILKLIQKPKLTLAPAGSAGLYHNAIVFERQAALAKTLDRIFQVHPTCFTGSADHLVSEAFYFSDPENNGLELYFDKDPKTWQWHHGQIQMDSLTLDPMEYISLHAERSAFSTKKIGHVHLKVGSIEKAKEFYVDIIGFKITAELPSALFLSDGFYHHQLGMNVWESYGAEPRSASLGLNKFEVLVQTATQLKALADRLAAAKLTFEATANQLTVNDPWKNQLKFGIFHPKKV